MGSASGSQLAMADVLDVLECETAPSSELSVMVPFNTIEFDAPAALANQRKKIADETTPSVFVPFNTIESSELSPAIQRQNIVDETAPSSELSILVPFNTLEFETPAAELIQHESTESTTDVSVTRKSITIAQETRVMRFPQIGGLATKLEKKKVERLNFSAPYSLEVLLKSIYEELQPCEADRLARIDILQRLSVMIGRLDTCREAVVLPFGSFESDLYTAWGDLDISLILPCLSKSVTRSMKQRILKSVREALYKSGGATRLQLLFSPRIPILMFEDAYFRISCDLCVSNSAAVLKSRVIGWLSRIDQRCRQLIFLVKCWAKAQCINNPKLGTLNSYAISQLVIFHLQTRDVPILPPLSSIFSEGLLCEPADEALKQCLRNVQWLTSEGFGSQNTSTTAELFISFFAQFSAVEDLWHQGLVVSTFHGKWCDRNTTDSSWKSKGYAMLVEDPFDLSDNCTRSVHESTIKLVCKAFSLTLETLLNKSFYWFPSTLRERLFQWPSGMPRPLQATSGDPKPGIQQLEEYLTSAVPRFKAKENKLEKLKQAAVKAQRRASQGDGQQLADGIASISLEKQKKGKKVVREEQTKDPEQDVLMSVRNLFSTPHPRHRIYNNNTTNNNKPYWSGERPYWPQGGNQPTQSWVPRSSQTQ